MPSDYYQIISRMIDAAREDPAVLRRAVYELTRLKLFKQAVAKIPPLTNSQIWDQRQALEAAIFRFENDIARRGPNPEPDAMTYPSNPDSSSVEPEPKIEHTEHALERTEPNIEHTEPGAQPNIADPPRPAFVETAPRERAIRLIPNTGLAMRLGGVAVALLIGFAVISTVRLDLAAPQHHPTAELTPSRDTPSSNTPLPLTEDTQPPAPAADAQPAAPILDQAKVEPSSPLNIPIPDRAGVFAVSRGQLVELEPLPAAATEDVSARRAIVDPSRTHLADGKVVFVARRREFITSAPLRVPVNIVAHISREITKVKERVSTTPMSGVWFVRNKGYELDVTVSQQESDLIVIRPDRPDSSLTPGRYALLLNGVGYDFTVDGAVTDPAHCVERTATATGDVYSECPKR